MTAAEDRLRGQLETAGANLSRLEAEVDVARAEVAKLVRRAEGKFPIRQIALAAGLSRTTVYKLLED